MEKLKQSIECCDVFKSTRQKFEWFSFDEDGKKVYAMPYIDNNGTKYRINHCFSCGKEIRDIQLKYEY